MFEYMDSDALSIEDKLLSLINDMKDFRNALEMLADEIDCETEIGSDVDYDTENNEREAITDLLDGADEKTKGVIDRLYAVMVKLRKGA